MMPPRTLTLWPHEFSLLHALNEAVPPSITLEPQDVEDLREFARNLENHAMPAGMPPFQKAIDLRPWIINPRKVSADHNIASQLKQFLLGAVKAELTWLVLNEQAVPFIAQRNLRLQQAVPFLDKDLMEGLQHFWDDPAEQILFDPHEDELEAEVYQRFVDSSKMLDAAHTVIPEASHPVVEAFSDEPLEHSNDPTSSFLALRLPYNATVGTVAGMLLAWRDAYRATLLNQPSREPNHEGGGLQAEIKTQSILDALNRRLGQGVMGRGSLVLSPSRILDKDDLQKLQHKLFVQPTLNTTKPKTKRPKKITGDRWLDEYQFDFDPHVRSY